MVSGYTSFCIPRIHNWCEQSINKSVGCSLLCLFANGFVFVHRRHLLKPLLTPFIIYVALDFSDFWITRIQTSGFKTAVRNPYHKIITLFNFMLEIILRDFILKMQHFWIELTKVSIIRNKSE